MAARGGASEKGELWPRGEGKAASVRHRGGNPVDPQEQEHLMTTVLTTGNTVMC